MKTLYLLLTFLFTPLIFAQLLVVAPTCAQPCSPRVCPDTDQCCFCEEARRALAQVTGGGVYRACLERNCGEDWIDYYHALNNECNRDYSLEGCKAFELIPVTDPEHSDYVPPDDEENTERLIKAKRELALKAGIPSGVGALVLIIIAWCCADHRRKKKKMRLLKEKEAKEDAEKSAAAEAALKPEPAVTEHNVTPQPYGPYQAQYQQPVAGAYFPPSSTGSGSQQQLMEDELAFQERRLAERKRALEERKRIAMEEERIAAEEEELRKRKMEGGRLSTYELGGN